MRRAIVLLVLLLVTASCAEAKDAIDGVASTTTEAEGLEITTTEAEETTTSEAEETTTSEAEEIGGDDEPALGVDDGLWILSWDSVHPTYLPNTGPASDPFFHIHTSADEDGFYLSFEMFTIWGEAWSGDLGRFPISCLDIVNDTGICVHFDPDGPGPQGDIAADFGGVGEMTIHQLDEAGYSITVHSLSFTDGTAFAPFEMSG